MHKETTRKLNFGEKNIWESFGKMIANAQNNIQTNLGNIAKTLQT